MEAPLHESLEDGQLIPVVEDDLGRGAIQADDEDFGLAHVNLPHSLNGSLNSMMIFATSGLHQLGRGDDALDQEVADLRPAELDLLGGGMGADLLVDDRAAFLAEREGPEEERDDPQVGELVEDVLGGVRDGSTCRRRRGRGR